MGKAALVVLVVAIVIGAGVGVAFATGAFNSGDSGGGGESEDDWRDHVGERTIYETSGKESTPLQLFPVVYTGTATNTLLYMDEKTNYWFINYAYERTYKIGWETRTISGDSNEWGLDSDYEEVDHGQETITTKYYGEKLCHHITLSNDVIGHTEEQWIGVDDGITYYVEAKSVTGVGLQQVTNTSVMHYKSSDKVDVKINFNVSAYTDEGITVTGTGSYQIGEEVTLTATGDDFYGWYDFDVSIDVPVSKERTYKFNITSDKELYALKDDVDRTYTSGTEVTLTAGTELSEDAVWEITQFHRNDGTTEEPITLEGSSPTYTFSEPGDYRLKIEGTTADGAEYNGFRILFVDGTLEQKWEFGYDDRDITISLDIVFSDYIDYMEKLPESERRDNSKDRQNYDSQFVVVDKYIEDLVSQFKSLQTEYGWTDVETAGCILAFTQIIPYNYDDDTHAASEYWNFPVETLYLNTGDCEDTSILASSIYKGMGYRSALILMSGHMAVGILGTDLSGYSEFSEDHKTFSRSGYYYGETTSTDYDLGEIPSGVRYVDRIVIDVKE